MVTSNHAEPRPEDERSSGRSPRVLFINQYYWPDLASTAQHLTDLAESLAQQGYEVHVLCGSGSYRTKKDSRLPNKEVNQGVTIHRVKVTSLGRSAIWKRLVDYASFYLTATWSAITMRRFDIVVTLTTPPALGLLGTILQAFRGSRHVSWSMDLHPEASFALGQMKPKAPLSRLLQSLVSWSDRHASMIVSLGPYMSQALEQRGVDPDRIHEVGVWSRAEEIVPRSRGDHPLRAELGLNNHFVVMYSGNLGMAHSFDEILEAATILREEQSIVFLFVGRGPRRSQVEQVQRERGLNNLQILDYVPRERLGESLTVADVHLISLRPEMVGLVVPGKLYGAMASGRACLFVGPEKSESAEAIRAGSCGTVIANGHATQLAELIRGWASDPETIRIMGRRARAAFLARHERREACQAWTELLSGVLNPSLAGRSGPSVEAQSFS